MTEQNEILLRGASRFFCTVVLYVGGVLDLLLPVMRGEQAGQARRPATRRARRPPGSAISGGGPSWSSLPSCSCWS